MRTFFVISGLCLFLCSCHQKEFPDSKFSIPDSVRDLVRCYKTNDTLVFKSSTNRVDSFVISSIDSMTLNEKPFFMTPANGKSITLKYRQIPIDKWQNRWLEGKGDGETHEHAEDGIFISVHKNPYTNETVYHYNFEEFRCSTKQLPLLNRDTIKVGTAKITNYYKIENCAVVPRDSAAIRVCFSTVDKGLVAYVTRDDVVWTRQN